MSYLEALLGALRALDEGLERLPPALGGKKGADEYAEEKKGLDKVFEKFDEFKANFQREPGTMFPFNLLGYTPWKNNKYDYFPNGSEKGPFILVENLLMHQVQADVKCVPEDPEFPYRIMTRIHSDDDSVRGGSDGAVTGKRKADPGPLWGEEIKCRDVQSVMENLLRYIRMRYVR